MTAQERERWWTNSSFSSLLLAFQAVLVVLYATCTEFSLAGLPLMPTEATSAAVAEQSSKYSYLIEIQLMVICGIAFLYSLMPRFVWSGVSFTYLLAVLCLQWSVLCAGFAQLATSSDAAAAAPPPSPGGDSQSPAAAPPPPSSGRIPLSVTSFMDAHGVAATVLISLGAAIGRLSPVQMALMVLAEVPAAVCFLVALQKMKATDPGGAMSIHAFGAAFGLALAAVIGDAPSKAAAEAERAERLLQSPSSRGSRRGQRSGGRAAPSSETGVRSTHERGAVAMIGTIILFCLWPSFNAGPLSGHAASRAAINTLLSLCGSVAASFAASRALRGGELLDMEHVGNSTLAGGAVISAAADMITNPGHALLCGVAAGLVSVASFTHGQPALRRAGLYDACGIFSLHLLPGVLGGLVSAVAAARIAPPLWPEEVIAAEFPGRAAGRSAAAVGMMQAGATMVAVVMGAAAGAGTGAACRCRWSDPMRPHQFYNDAGLWLLPEEGEEGGKSASAAGGGDDDGEHCEGVEELQLLRAG